MRQRLLLLMSVLIVLLAVVPSADARPIKRKKWITGVLVTEYYPVPEAWFKGERVRVRGLTGKHRVDWLFSATGVSMEGDGVALDGRQVHIDNLGSQGWVNAEGKRTLPSIGGWSNGSPFWRAVGWRNRNGRVTFPLEQGGWSRGIGTRYVKPSGISFDFGPSKDLHYYQSVAVDPDLIPLGSRVYIPAYRNSPGKGWFSADDVGGAIDGRHLDVYRTAPDKPGGANSYESQRVYVIPPGR